ncbi:MAG: hypothetical protein IJU92_03240 [Spirochaetaceae bacterium]|nr:hypothetical protein [Spirochaetaceae bacterium]
MDNAEILRPLLEKGDLRKTLDYAETEQKALFDIRSEGLNLVTASILADIASMYKTDLIRKVGALFSSAEYCELLNQKVFTIAPEKRSRLKDQGVILTPENSVQYSEWFNIFEIAFPWLPLSVFEDFVAYLHDDKSLMLDKESIDIVRENFTNSKRYSERELEQIFSSEYFK